MKVYGLTGGIASGKSTVTTMLEELGAVIIDADRIARQVVEPGREAYSRILETFGKEFILPDGRLDRRKLRRAVFADEEKRNKLNSIVHPEVMKETADQLQKAEDNGAEIVIYEAALLVEIGYYKNFDGLIVVKCDIQDQKDRLIKRDRVSEAEVSYSFKSQSSTEEKLKYADYVIDNGQTLENTFKQVEKLWETLSTSTEN